MARGRMILRTVGRDGKIAAAVVEFGFGIAVLHHRLLAFIDCNGNVAADVSYLMANIFPRDSGILPDECRKLADGLVAYGLVIQFESDGLPFFHFPHFLEHQVGLRVDREKPEFPPFAGSLPDECRQITGRLPVEVKLRELELEVELEEKRREYPPKGGSGGDATALDLFVKRWNEEVCVKIPQMRPVAQLTLERKRLLTARLKIEKPKFTIENIIAALEQSPYARGTPSPGETKMSKSWLCDFDWILGKPLKRGGPDRPDNWIKLYEGKYHARIKPNPMSKKFDNWGRE